MPAIYKSDFCWEHIEDKEGYKKRILQPGKDGKVNLLGANLEDVNLGGLDLRGACLWRTRLWGANLEGTKLNGADLKRSDLSWANLQGANLVRANLWEATLRRVKLTKAELRGADLMGANLIGASLRSANLTNADLRHANLNEADLTNANLTGAKVWGMSHAGCKTEGVVAAYLNFDKDGKGSGIVPLNKEQVEEFFSSQPTIEILLQDRLPPYAMRTLLDLIEKINEQNPEWEVELKKYTSSSFLSELMFKATKDEVLDEVAKLILGAFDKKVEERLLEYLPEKKASRERALILRKLLKIEKRIDNPVQQVTIIKSTGQIPVNIDFREAKVRDIKIFGDVGKMINVEGNYYEISAPEGREDLMRNLLNQLDSPEIDKTIEQAEAELKGLSPEQVKFLEKQLRKSVEKIFKEKQKEVGFLDKVKAFSQRISESAASGVISSAIWHVIQKLGFPGM